MTTENFATRYENLPNTLPLFPLPNAVVMPGCQLPLNIFEPRYLNMVQDALRADRLIGMVQPEPDPTDGDDVVIYRTGTAGRITFFNETDDGRLLIVLTGVCRFDIVEELPALRGYREAQVDWNRFRLDYDETAGDPMPGNRQQLMNLLKTYFAHKHMETDWSAVDKMDTLALVNRLTCALPIEPVERQLLIEAVSPETRMSSLLTLLRYETLQTPSVSTQRH
ncbi:LON peptidase substrate-binding domain-containing protein [Methylococcus sp. EFPC2]|uniref:LON peptidase substrate-binding domain-containing protein n=1 Tax=Methylococcus sp. EFPC2 TaxID=2812648 RepID=UPI001966E936|nr:LON peptidase substrate-binding domain-containing protein [Methylococcus sp. EFPC2]QSA96995.1 LON peptidase substrate-binding domain-containing protein [Methylococcus sp. EFPC2]